MQESNHLVQSITTMIMLNIKRYGFTEVYSKYRFIQSTAWGFGSAEKMSVIKPKYDFYENAAFLDDPHNADLTRKPKAIAHKIGTEPRVSL